MSYIRFWISRCSGNIGRNGKKALAISTLKTLPKLELAVILMYLSILAKVRRPSITPCSSTIRLFSSRIISAASLAISTAESTEIPISAARSAGASLIPSPIKPTTWPCWRSSLTIRSLCNGVSLANTVVRAAACASCWSSICSISLPRST
ncbi:hypothetical protein D3C81_1518130 [compost metagenome]